MINSLKDAINKIDNTLPTPAAIANDMEFHYHSGIQVVKEFIKISEQEGQDITSHLYEEYLGGIVDALNLLLEVDPNEV